LLLVTKQNYIKACEEFGFFVCFVAFSDQHFSEQSTLTNSARNFPVGATNGLSSSHGNSLSQMVRSSQVSLVNGGGGGSASPSNRQNELFYTGL
jgi:hypothetical protein